MKFLDILSENTNISFKNKCNITIINSKGKEITVDCEIPKTQEEKSIGLMYRDNLCDNCGMFYDEVNSGFWMKNVKFPLDMIFAKNGIIVDIKKALPNDPTIISPSEDSDWNLEVNEGFCEKNNISLGDKIYRS
jgi:uncharacterized membrane protein (UPF0127 family)